MRERYDRDVTLIVVCLVLYVNVFLGNNAVTEIS